MEAPRTETAIIPDFDEKCAAICRQCVGEPITAFAGVPSWNLALMRRVLEYTGRKNLLEVWPRLEMFAHGGVEFAPYRTSFEELIPSEKMKYMETYNASEGFFAMADDPSRSDMLLMLDYGTFFEFRSGTQIVPLEGVECGKVYAVLITSNNGLWRYEIGDTVEFTSTNPYRIRFAGRTRQYINVFGEELIVDNAEHALLAACRKTGAVVSEYSVAPCYMSLRERGAHEWIVEFEREPDSLERFAEALDGELRAVNSDYDAKRRTTLERQRLMPDDGSRLEHRFEIFHLPVPGNGQGLGLLHIQAPHLHGISGENIQLQGRFFVFHYRRRRGNEHTELGFRPATQTHKQGNCHACYFPHAAFSLDFVK